LKHLKNKYKTFHFNIKPSNIFIDEKTCKIKLGDFGQSKTKTKPDCSVTSKSIVPGVNYGHFVAPEMRQAIIDNKTHVDLSAERCDVFSLGMVIL